jgi:hypothetical protein
LSGLFDFFQSASNTVADNVAGPVDLINAGLGLFGLRSKEPVGGSEWMKRWGLKRDVEMGGARLAGETAGLLSPALLAAKAPQIAKGLLQAQENAAIPRQMHPEMGAIVYHGSPHKFDKFDSSKIGTGEGAQAYGHGLYLAESPDVAGIYQKTLSGRLPTGWSDKYPESARAYIRGVVGDVADGSLTAEKAAKYIQNANANMRSYPADKLAAELAEGANLTKGNLYKVDLPDEAIAKMLDWDKPLSQQAPEVQKAIAGSNVRLSSMQGGHKIFDPAMPWQGGHAYQDLTSKLTPSGVVQVMGPGSGNSKGAAQRLASEHLRELGIPGIRYLDGGSRGAGTGTSNYVVFPGEEHLLKILERNGGLMGP